MGRYGAGAVRDALTTAPTEDNTWLLQVMRSVENSEWICLIRAWELEMFWKAEDNLVVGRTSEVTDPHQQLIYTEHEPTVTRSFDQEHSRTTGSVEEPVDLVNVILVIKLHRTLTVVRNIREVGERPGDGGRGTFSLGTCVCYTCWRTD